MVKPQKRGQEKETLICPWTKPCELKPYAQQNPEVCERSVFHFCCSAKGKPLLMSGNATCTKINNIKINNTYLNFPIKLSPPLDKSVASVLIR